MSYGPKWYVCYTECMCVFLCKCMYRWCIKNMSFMAREHDKNMSISTWLWQQEYVFYGAWTRQEYVYSDVAVTTRICLFQRGCDNKNMSILTWIWQQEYVYFNVAVTTRICLFWRGYDNKNMSIPTCSFQQNDNIYDKQNGLIVISCMHLCPCECMYACMSTYIFMFLTYR